LASISLNSVKVIASSISLLSAFFATHGPINTIFVSMPYFSCTTLLIATIGETIGARLSTSAGDRILHSLQLRDNQMKYKFLFLRNKLFISVATSQRQMRLQLQFKTKSLIIPIRIYDQEYPKLCGKLGAIIAATFGSFSRSFTTLSVVLRKTFAP